MLNQVSSAIELMANITRHRSKLAVENALIENLYKFIDCESLCLLRLNQRHKENHVISCYPSLETTHKALAQHISIKHHVAAPDTIVVNDIISLSADLGVVQYDSDKNAYFFPAIISEWLTDIVCVYGVKQRLTDSQVLVISRLITVYSDFIHVLEEGERDVLTGLLNRKTFDSRLDDLLKESYLNAQPNILAEEKREDRKAFEAHDISHWIGVLDIDHFKSINDGFGHIYGDEVLLLFSDLMRKIFRNNDLLFRFGGEEFIVFLLNINEKGAESAFERFRYELEQYDFPQVGSVTVSIGLTCMDEGVHTATLLDQADKALYYAKEHGRNQVCNYARLSEQGVFKHVEIKDDIDLF